MYACVATYINIHNALCIHEHKSKDGHYRQSTSDYRIYCKSFGIEKFCGCRNKLSYAGKHSRLHGDLVWPNPIAQAISLEKFCDYRSIH